MEGPNVHDQLGTRLHDASLVSTIIEWDRREVELTFRLAGSRNLRLTTSGTCDVSVPMREPWGPSSSVNNARTVSVTAGYVRLEIEMQSGDVIRIDARSVQSSEP